MDVDTNVIDTFPESDHPIQEPGSRPRKRRLEVAAKRPRSRVKRLKSDYKDEYRSLYNEEISRLVPKTTKDEDVFEESQIGMVIWRPIEKATFFRSLDRRGRHDLRGISSDVGSKSEPEVFQYLELLQDSLSEELLKTSPSEILRQPVEAALEIGSACNDALDGYADALSSFIQRDEEKAEAKKYDDLWLLTASIGQWAEDCIDGNPEESNDLSQKLPAARLLNLKHLLLLSKTFFMNSSDPNHNWRSYNKKAQAPTIINTAFSELHALTIDFTKTIIRAVLIVAMSRMRARSTPLSEVKPSDVHTALKLLRVRPNGRGFWVGLARRCNLSVYEKVRGRTPSGKHYTFDEVESILASTSEEITGAKSSKGFTEKSHLLSKNHLDDDLSSATSSPTSVSDVPASESSRDPVEPSPVSCTVDSSTCSPGTAVGEISEYEELEKQEDAVLEALDLQQSAREESRLYKFLKIQPIPSSLGPPPPNTTVPGQKTIKLSKRSRKILEQRQVDRGADWMGWLDYRAEWGTLAGPAPDWMFTHGLGIEQRGRKRQVELNESRERNNINSDVSTDPEEGIAKMESDGEEKPAILKNKIPVTSKVKSVFPRPYDGSINPEAKSRGTKSSDEDVSADEDLDTEECNGEEEEEEETEDDDLDDVHDNDDDDDDEGTTEDEDTDEEKHVKSIR